MRREEFATWVKVNCSSASRRYKSNIISRAKRVECAFQAIDPDFSYDREFAKDGGATLLDNLGKEGRALIGSGVDLPLGTNQMFSIRAAVMWYMKFLASS